MTGGLYILPLLLVDFCVEEGTGVNPVFCAVVVDLCLLEEKNVNVLLFDPAVELLPFCDLVYAPNVEGGNA